MITLTNSFHNSVYRTRLTTTDLDRIEMIAGTRPDRLTASEKSTIRRIRKALCGITGCTCGDFWGRRK